MLIGSFLYVLFASLVEVVCPSSVRRFVARRSSFSFFFSLFFLFFTFFSPFFFSFVMLILAQILCCPVLRVFYSTLLDPYGVCRDSCFNRLLCMRIWPSSLVISNHPSSDRVCRNKHSNQQDTPEKKKRKRRRERRRRRTEENARSEIFSLAPVTDGTDTPEAERKKENGERKRGAARRAGVRKGPFS